MINKNTINFGLLLGGISVVSFLLQVVLEPGWMMAIGLSLVFFLIMIILLVRFIKSERKLNNGIISFKEAFVKGFTSLFIASLISVFVTLIYVNLIDPAYVDRMILRTMETTAGFMEGSVSDDIMATTLKEMETNMAEAFTLMGQLKSFAQSLAFFAILALIVAAILKRKPEPTDEIILDA